jgi:uncharacterized repeat protein (TIGR03803 family)
MWLCAAAAMAFVHIAGAWALAQTTTLRTHTGDSNTANLVQAADGTIYGVTRPSSINSTANGTIFKLQPDGSDYQVAYAFPTGSSATARLPDYSFILGRDGALYGTGEFGGTANFGMIYKVNPDGSGFSLLRSFNNPSSVNYILDAGAPKGGLVHASDGFLYGTTTYGTTSTNIDNRKGVVFRVAPDGSGYRIVFSFDGAPNYSNGLAPNSLIIGRDGNLYGTARVNGTIYRLLPDGSAFQIIHSFANFSAPTPALGLEPAGAFFQGRDGSLYGRTNSGGTIGNNGVIYKIRPDGSGYRVLASFPTSRSPYFGGLIQGLDGALYATTSSTIIRVVEAPGLEITQQPRSQTIATGGVVTFTVTAPGATTYQWRRNGTAIAGATAAAYTLTNLTAAANATYSVVVGNGTDNVTSDGAVLLVATPIPGRLINLSVRTSAGTGAQTLIAGFVVGGTGSKQVLVRAIGPTLGIFGLTGVLADPQLGLFNSASAQIASNTGWGGTAALTNAFISVGAFPLAATTRDSALLSPLPAGGYSAQVVSASGATGVALVEAYDADAAASASRFINLSARTLAGTGAQTLIAGFVLSGNVPRTLLIRGVGPGLNQFGVTGTLANPRLELHTTVNNADTTVATNSGWAGAAALAAAFTQVGAFALPATSVDAALLVTLTPGSYTAQVAGAGTTTGVALVEVYEVP